MSSIDNHVELANRVTYTAAGSSVAFWGLTPGTVEVIGVTVSTVIAILSFAFQVVMRLRSERREVARLQQEPREHPVEKVCE